MSKLVIGFVGYPACGKTVAAEVARELGIPVVVMGDVVREETRRRGFPEEDRYVGEVATSLRMEEGMDAIARRCIPKIEQYEIAAVDGIRGDYEVHAFKHRFGDSFVLVAIDSPAEIRFERVVRRGRKDATMSWEEFVARDRREDGFGLARAMQMADYVIENSGGMDEFKLKVKEILMKEISRRGVRL